MALSRTEKNVFIHAGIAFAVFAVLVVFTMLIGGDIERRAKTQQMLRGEDNFRSEAILSFVALRNEYNKAQIYFSLLENILPHQDKLINFPKDMKALGKQNGVDVSATFGAETQSTNATPGFVQFQMTINGALTKILEFIKGLRSSSYVTDLSSLELGWEVNGAVSASIAGKVFFR